MYQISFTLYEIGDIFLERCLDWRHIPDIVDRRIPLHLKLKKGWLNIVHIHEENRMLILGIYKLQFVMQNFEAYSTRPCVGISEKWIF